MKEKIQIQLSGGGLSSTALTVIKIKELDHIFVADYDQDDLTSEWEAVNKTVTALSMPYPLVKCKQLNLKFNNWLKKANSKISDVNYSRGTFLMFVIASACEAISMYGVDKPIEILTALTNEDTYHIPVKQFLEEINDVLLVSFGLTAKEEQLITLVAPYSHIPYEDTVSIALGKIQRYRDVENCLGADEYIIWDYSMPSERKNKIYKKFRG